MTRRRRAHHQRDDTASRQAILPLAGDGGRDAASERHAD